jgi:hypothetical protein
MAVQALREPAERGHLVGDVPVLAIIGVVLLAFLRRHPGALLARDGGEHTA